MMLFASIYGVVDGFFVSNFVGSTALAAVNLIYPYVTVLAAVGFMAGSGGSALVAMLRGEGRDELANRVFSMIVFGIIIIGIALTIIGELTVPSVAKLMGADGELFDLTVSYGRICMGALACFMLQYIFQSLLITAERPKLGLAVTVIAGMTNIALDALFVAGLHLGIQGAAAATVISCLMGGLIPLIYFALPNKSPIRLCKPIWNGAYIFKICTNGSSELMSNVSLSLVGMLYNVQLMRIAGENAVAAYSVVMYVSFIFYSGFLGYATGSAPIISYHYGAGDTDELKSMFKKSLVIMGVLSTAMLVGGEVFAKPLAALFVSYNGEIMDLTVKALMIYSICYLPCGFNVFGSAFFTALNNGKVSALLAFLRLFVFEGLCVIVFPIFLGLDGIWFSSVAAEAFALIITILFFVKMRSKYDY